MHQKFILIAFSLLVQCVLTNIQAKSIGFNCGLNMTNYELVFSCKSGEFGLGYTNITDDNEWLIEPNSRQVYAVYFFYNDLFDYFEKNKHHKVYWGMTCGALWQNTCSKEEEEETFCEFGIHQKNDPYCGAKQHPTDDVNGEIGLNLKYEYKFEHISLGLQLTESLTRWLSYEKGTTLSVATKYNF